MFWDFIQKIPEFLHFTLADLAKVLIGAFMVGFMAVGWVRSIRKATKAQVRAEEHRRAAEAEKERAEFYRQTSELKSQHAEAVLRLREQVMDAERCRSEAESEREKLAVALASGSSACPT